MNKTLIALAVLAGFAGAAAAQSSVTLSGSIDAGVIRKNSDTSMGGAASSRNNITFSGVEDLGNGNSAFFTLNHRFAINGTQNGANTTQTGAATAEASQFYRNAFVGLKNNNIGDVRLGRVLFPLQEINGGFEPWNGGDTVGNVHTDGRAANAATSTLRANSTIYLRSANFGGFVGHAAVAAADGGTTQTGNKVKPQGFGGVFTFGPATVAAAYDRNGYDLSTTGVYAKYNAGFATFFAQYEEGDAGKFTPATGSTKVSSEDVGATDKRVSISAAIPYGAFTGKIGYREMSINSIAGKAKKVGLGLDYALSKRTTIYTDFSKSGGSDAELVNASGTTAVNARKEQFDIGVQHKF